MVQAEGTERAFSSLLGRPSSRHRGPARLVLPQAGRHQKYELRMLRALSRLHQCLGPTETR